MKPGATTLLGYHFSAMSTALVMVRSYLVGNYAARCWCVAEIAKPESGS
jgi:hypothetical protein